MPPQGDSVPLSEVKRRMEVLQSEIDKAQARAEVLLGEKNALIEQRNQENAELQDHLTALQTAYDALIADPQIPNESLVPLDNAITDLKDWLNTPSES